MVIHKLHNSRMLDLVGTLKFIYFNAQFWSDKKRHRYISDFSKVKYFRGRMWSKTWLEGSFPPQDGIASHSEDFVAVTCQPPFLETCRFPHWWVDEYPLSFWGWMRSSTLGSLYTSLHQTPVTFFIEKPPIENLIVLCSKTSLEEVTWGCRSRNWLSRIIPLRNVNSQRAFTVHCWRE